MFPSPVQTLLFVYLSNHLAVGAASHSPSELRSVAESRGGRDLVPLVAENSAQFFCRCLVIRSHGLLYNLLHLLRHLTLSAASWLPLYCPGPLFAQQKRVDAPPAGSNAFLRQEFCNGRGAMPLGMVKENSPLGVLAEGSHCVSSVCAQNAERSFISPVHGMKNGRHYFERGVNGSATGRERESNGARTGGERERPFR